jgi:hypothetical protein
MNTKLVATIILVALVASTLGTGLVLILAR